MKSKNHHHYSTRIALGTRLKNWRTRENRKISDAAAMLGVCTSTWGHWETGTRLPSGDLLLAIESLTGIPLYVLFCPFLDTCPQMKSGQIALNDYPCCQHRVSQCGIGLGGKITILPCVEIV